MEYFQNIIKINADFTVLSLEMPLEQSACIGLRNWMGLGGLGFVDIQVSSDPKVLLWIGLASHMTRNQP